MWFSILLSVLYFVVGFGFGVFFTRNGKKLGNLIVDATEEGSPNYYISVDETELKEIPKRGFVILDVKYKGHKNISSNEE